jgi:sodium/hydrogen antiporter
VPLVLTFAILLLAGVLISCRARQSVLSTSSLFLIAALLLGRFSIVQAPQRQVLYQLAEIALYSVLFSDGMKTGGLKMLGTRWRLVSRILFVGMPVTIGLIALLAHTVLALDWRSSIALGAVLSPTDPVFVAAIFAVEAVPVRVKEALNVESGFNDGLALPIVFLLVPELMKGSPGVEGIVLQLVEGLGLGIAVPLLLIKVEQLSIFGVAGVYQRLYPFAIGLILYAIYQLVNANLFLAAFSAGLTIATIRGELRTAFDAFSEPVTELLKLATILIFALRTGKLVFTGQDWKVYVVVVLSAFFLRMVAVWVSLVGSDLSTQNRLVIGWFGPKGFASLVYGIMLLETREQGLHEAAMIVALTVAVSIFVYSSTDVLLSNMLSRSAKHQSSQPEVKAS